MGSRVTQLYRRIDENRAYCFNVESSRPLTAIEMDCLRLVLADGFLVDTVSLSPKDGQLHKFDQNGKPIR